MGCAPLNPSCGPACKGVPPLAAHVASPIWGGVLHSAADAEKPGAGPATPPYGLDEIPNLMIYIARGEVRPAYQRAFRAQREVWERALLE